MIKNIDHKNVINYGTDSLIIKSGQTGFGKPVCRKILTEEFPSAEIISQLENEFEICSKVNCASIRKAYKKEKEEDHLFIELEFIEGKDLNKFLATGKLDFLQQLNLAVDLVTALSDLQRENIFFRQIHPSNILIEQATNKIFFIDFGLASHNNSNEAAYARVNEKQIEVLKYISPEQTGRINRAIDNRADLYSLGIILYKLFTGVLPFESNDGLELIYAHVAKEPEEPSDFNKQIPKPLSAIILKLLSKNAEERYQSAFGLKADLETCLKKYSIDKRIDEFELGQSDNSGKLFIPSTLFGREKEIEKIQNLFLSSVRGSKTTLLISGLPGCGKSALVDTLQQPAIKRKGFFIKGKFDQINRAKPYSTFVQSFGELMHIILTGEETQHLHLRKKITDSLGNTMKILPRFIAGLDELVGKVTELPNLKSKEFENQVNYEFIRFLKTLSDSEHPLIIFVDDLQWADDASVKLFQIIAESRETEYVMLIGAYRINEVDESHPMIRKMHELKNSNVLIDEIDLRDLRYEDVHELITNTLLSKQQDIAFLSDLIYTKTKGNAFYVWQFLKSIYSERFLWFDFDTQRWQWNVDLIMQMNVSGNVVDLMTSYVKKLPEETMELLEAASTLGNRFEKRTLSVIKQLNEKKVDSLLNISNTEGLIIPFGNEYKFAHDRVQQAIYSLIPEKKKAALHLSNGRKLAEHYSHFEFQEKLFEIVNQWNMGTSQVTDKVEKVYLSNLNKQAGQKALSSAAYPQALHYFEIGIEVLGNEFWNEQYDLLLQLTTDAADAAYLSGEYSKVDDLVKSLLENSRSLADSVKGYEVEIKKLIAQNKLIEAVKFGLQILHKLGIRFPLKPGKLSIMLDLLKTKFLLRNKSAEYFNNLPVMEDAQKNAAMRIMSDITSAAYFAVPNLVPLLVFKMVNHSVKYGLSHKSPFSFAAYGFILSVHLKEIDKGSSYGEIAYHLAKKIKADEALGSIISTSNVFLVHWKTPLDELKDELEKAFKTSIEYGDHEWASYAAHNYVYQLFFVGSALPQLAKKAESLDLQIEKFKQDLTLKRLRLFRQAIENLVTESQNPDQLTGNIYDESEMDLDNVTKGNEVYFQNLFLLKLYLALVFNKEDQAKRYLEYVERYQENVLGTAMEPLMYFYRSLCISDSSVNFKKRKSILKQIKKDIKALKRFEKISPHYNAYKVQLLLAEYSHMKGKNESAKIYFDRALKTATENGLTNDLALCWERAGQFFISTKQDLLARFYMMNAYRSYKRWGAEAKMKQMEIRYPNLVGSGFSNEWIQEAQQSQAREKIGSLDLDTVMKASFALSGEIVLPQLLKKMMKIIMENAGAEKGFLVMEKNGERFIEAEINANNEDLKVLESTPVKQSGLLAESILNYVNLTQESVILDDVSKSQLFANDPVVKKNGSKSVLCIPLINMGKLQAIIYLSNDLTYGAFTENRVALLKLLAGQMAISIENALFYSELENKVKARTNELEQEKKKSDDLLLNILPEEIAEELKSTGRTTPRSYEVATVMFTDFENFTTKSEKLSPEELVSMIDTCFKKFDEIVSRYNIEKIKTIGDAYLCVSGLPVKTDHNAGKVVKAAMEIIESIKAFQKNEADKGYFNIRIGIHTGPLIAGVVGDKKFAYDIWGDTVNTAARMEQNSEPNKINISQNTYDLIKDEFNCTFRGKKEAKNKGMIEMYFVEGEK